jgi:xanthine dehydrogenase YagR molybdenum-binding subunit
VDVEYAGEPGRYDFAAFQDQAYAPEKMVFGIPVDTTVGDFAAGFEAAEVRLDQRYTTPYAFSLPLEPHACLVVREATI